MKMTSYRYAVRSPSGEWLGANLLWGDKNNAIFFEDEAGCIEILRQKADYDRDYLIRTARIAGTWLP